MYVYYWRTCKNAVCPAEGGGDEGQVPQCERTRLAAQPAARAVKTHLYASRKLETQSPAIGSVGLIVLRVLNRIPGLHDGVPGPLRGCPVSVTQPRLAAQSLLIMMQLPVGPFEVRGVTE